MSRKTSVLALCSALGLLSLTVAEPATADETAAIEKGRYLSILGGCAACHTVAGEEPFSGGVPLDTPFGLLVGSNITPDKETGIGSWTFEDFQNSMSEGKGKGGHHLYPAMPYPAYTKVTREDNEALWAYFQSLKPVRKQIVSDQLPFPYDQRGLMIGWNLLNFSQGEFKPDPSKSETWNRGAYIVEGLGHCGSCHTPKSSLGGDEKSRPLAGYATPAWFSKDITSNSYSGIGDWSVDDLAEYMKTGRNRFDIATGPMATVVRGSSQYWNDADLKAVATYLKETPASATAAVEPLSGDDPRMANGADIYALYCTGCHAPTGAGIHGIYPRLADTSMMRGESATSVLHVVVGGSRKNIDTALNAPGMPPFGRPLTDTEIGDVVTFLRNRWGNAAGPVSDGDVKAMRDLLQKHSGAKE